MYRSRRAKETTRREQQLEDSTQREPSQFEPVEAHLCWNTRSYGAYSIWVEAI